MKKFPIPGYEGLYEITNTGEIYSIARKVKGRDGNIYPFPAKHKTKSLNKSLGYFTVTLYKNNQEVKLYIHRLVALAFIPNPHNKPEVNHIDGDKTNNHASNLEWVTSSENSYHASNTGLRVYTNRLTYSEFIDCLKSVISGESYGSLSKRVPYKVPYLSTKLRKIAKELGIEHLLNESLHLQKQNRARENGIKNTK